MRTIMLTTAVLCSVLALSWSAIHEARLTGFKYSATADEVAFESLVRKANPTPEDEAEMDRLFQNIMKATSE